ncbi:MAG: translational activator for mitochondrial COX1 [Chaenotheca gracillima]|nr:MAG: translational activator for mitochondrial COX1 [Chaenotheca gracillima]
MSGPSVSLKLFNSLHESISHRSQPICRRCLHDTARKPATPLPITAHGPPPKAPSPASSQHDDRVERRRRQSEMLRQGQAIRASQKPGSALKKRFWKHVSVQEKPEGLQIHLDSRAIRTPAKTTLNVPHLKRQLAFAIALEWDLLVSAAQALKQHLIPLTSLVSRAEDIKSQDEGADGKTRNEIVETVMRYLDTDTLLCWAPEATSFSGTSTRNSEENTDDSEGQTRTLRGLQQSMAQPIIGFLSTHVWPGAEIQPVADSNSILPTPQPQMTKDIIRGWVSGLPPYELAGLERGVLATKSLLVGARFLAEWSSELESSKSEDHGNTKRFGVDEAAEAASLEVKWQTDMWGEVEDSHDVEKEDLRRQLGSVVLLVSSDQA